MPCYLEGQFLHQEINPGIHFKAMQVIGIPLESHEQATIGHIGRAEGKKKGSMKSESYKEGRGESP